MTQYADLEISLHRHSTDAYSVEFRFSQPDSDADIRLAKGEPALAQFDLDKLSSQVYDPAAYGENLSQSLFADPAVQTAFAQAMTSAQSLDAAVRLRLLIGPSAPELHNLLWETLRDPRDKTPLCTNENILFSRYLSSLDWRPVRLRPQGDLTALVIVANPSDLGDYDLQAVDVDGELNRAKNSLGTIPVTILPSAKDERCASLENLINCLRDAGDQDTYDIVYLICHGAFIKDQPWLWLEDENGKSARVSGNELVTRLKELHQRPRLVVLASCQSAADSAGEALAALGPRLAEAGVPAVIAMQGKVSMDTIASFMPVFFEELQRDGQIDRASAVARGAVRARPDYWMPTLFMRLKSGRIWYVPGFGEDRKDFEKWPSLLRSINRGQVTPILGPGLFEPLLGSMREIAQRWAETYHYPMAPYERESLPQVAQYLAVNQDRGFPYDELEEYLLQEIQARYQDELPPESGQGRPNLNQMIDAVAAARRARDPLEPYKVIAELPLPIYITTNFNALLSSALKEAGKDPQVVLCPWNEYVEQAESIYDREPEYFPSPERPLVYHLFGQFDEPDSVVLTEDDYFDFLIGVTSNNKLVPPAVRRALTDTALLFLGFQMDDWNFRVLFRSIISRQGGGRRDRYAHIAAQIEPEEGRILEPERARRYLENYFSKGADISIYWGSTVDFMKELQQHLKRNHP
jgi:hypothetical protein